jgi:outer membrane biosynthesis protein TonB
MRRLSFIVIVALGAHGTRSTSAQEPPQAPAGPASTPPVQGLQPPRLLSAGAPVYPEAKVGSGESATVALVLTLDSKGDVTDAIVASVPQCHEETA